ncbi:MAG: cyclopropane-fatty-acyl-phospholipid synthase family protein, partial [Bdellovibrionales bacterium]|nr:cyclopropane-fatty-acyl-phospholipid synthase family protein [Bdellovibrionales bacterium]
ELMRKALIKELKNSPIAIETDKANDQHYMVPPEFFLISLGPRLKYSCCHWDKAKNLAEAEEEMLALTVERAQIKDGDKILELGHGWGAITLYMAEKFPNSSITAVSNSKFQGDFIKEKAKQKGLKNINIITADVSTFETEETFDRVISVEMFEHMRNYKTLLKNVSHWLNDNGTLFVHIFAHKEISYKFEFKDDSDWMSKYFFSGGIMPSEHLFYYFQDDLNIKEHWRVNGKHYGKTARAWLENMDRNEEKILNIFKAHYPKGEAKKWFNYWRVFFMSCEELWNYKDGNEWIVAHYLFEKR